MEIFKFTAEAQKLAVAAQRVHSFEDYALEQIAALAEAARMARKGEEIENTDVAEALYYALFDDNSKGAPFLGACRAAKIRERVADQASELTPAAKHAERLRVEAQEITSQGVNYSYKALFGIE